jgi:hypothetical protein
MSIATLAIAGVFALRSPFDEQHQRRVFVLSSDNVRFLTELLLVLGLLNWVLSPAYLSRTIPSCRGSRWGARI